MRSPVGRGTTLGRDTIIGWLPGVYPLCLVLGLIAIPGGNILLRLGLLVAAAPGLLRLTDVRRTHRRFFAVMGAYLAVVALASFVAVESSIALVDLQRQTFLVVVAMGLSLALSVRRARVAFALGSVVVSVTATVSILSLYAAFAGIPQLGPVQESFKAYAAELGEFENAVSFAAVLAAALAAPYLARWPAILVLVAIAVALAVAASGSRTTAVSLIACFPVTAALLVLHRLRRIPRWIPYASMAVIGGWAALSFADRLGRLAVSPELNELTTGRSTLWAAAWSKFVERPVFGWGGGSFPSELASFLPGTAQIYYAENSIVMSAHGGAHNAMLTVLAERGLFAALVAITMSAFLLALGLAVFRARDRLHGIDRVFARLAPFVVVAILVRSLGEAPGWFGLADGLVDFLAYGFAAMLVAVASTLDQRAGQSRMPPPAPSIAPIGSEPAERPAADLLLGELQSRQQARLDDPEPGGQEEHEDHRGGQRVSAVQYTHAAGSGAARYVASLSRALKTQGVDVELLCPHDFAYAQEVSAHGVRVTNMTGSLATAPGRVAKVGRTIAQALVGAVLAANVPNRSRLVHMNFIGIPLFAVPVVAYLRFRGRRVILTVHDVLPHRRLLARRLWPLERLALRLLYRTPDHLIVHYPAAARKLRREFLIPSSRVTVIPHGADVREGAAIRDTTDSTVHVALLGSLRPNKGIHLAIGAVQELRRRGLLVELAIAGQPDGSDEGYWRMCQTLIDQAPDGLQVDPTFVSDARMRALLLDSDAVVLPYESFAAQSGVAIDAISAGRAIIATGAGGLDELLERSGAGIRIDSASHDAVCAAIEQAVALGRTGLAALGNAGATYAREELDWRRVADRHVALYDDLVRRP